jgi:ketosteroid isomerase-like protein
MALNFFKTTICNIPVAVILMAWLYISCMEPVKKTSDKTTGSALQVELEAIDSSMTDCYLKANADSLVVFYNKEFTYLPEYKPPIYETSDLQKFYAGWFMSQHIEFYKKKIYAVENIAGYVLEIGNFHLGYSTKAGAGKYYNGKYITMWKRDGSGRLKIISEAFGSDKYIKPEDMPYASVEVKETRKPDENILSQKLLPEIGEFDKGVVKAVLTGDGEARANEFTEDGIYMPHFDSMQIGMAMLKPYMLRTYTHNNITSVRDTFFEIFDTGDFVFLSGHFKVGFANGVNKGFFEGNVSNLMKRNENGKLLMYRQLAHN